MPCTATRACNEHWLRPNAWLPVAPGAHRGSSTYMVGGWVQKQMLIGCDANAMMKDACLQLACSLSCTAS